MSSLTTETNVKPLNENIVAFLTAGKAKFTVTSKTTGNHFTYKVTAPKEQSGKNNIYFCSVLNGPDNYSNYAYMGLLIQNGNHLSFKFTAKSKVTAEAPSVKGFVWLLNNLNVNNKFDHKARFDHAGSCAKCGKLLTHPDSILSGFGPTCRASL